jgi:hypothetical protein
MKVYLIHFDSRKSYFALQAAEQSTICKVGLYIFDLNVLSL